MADSIAQLCQVIAEVLRDEPELGQADLVARVEGAIASNPELASALQTDQRMLQINRDGARGFQTLVEEGGTVFIEGTHYHLTEPEKFEAAFEAVLQKIQTPKVKTFDFKPYLQSIVDDEEYGELQDVYTPTTVEGHKQVPQKKFSPRLKLQVETVKPPKERVEEGEASEAREQVEQWEVLAGLRNYAVDHVLLIGKPGSGKSTALAWLLWQEANTALQNPAAKIPVLVKLRRCTSAIENLIQDFFRGHQLSLSIADINELLLQGKLLLLLDGLNELPEMFRTEIDNFWDRCRSTTPMIVSTRELSVGGTLGIAKTLKMLPLTEPQMQEFVRGYLGEEGDRLFQQLKGVGEATTGEPRLRKFAETPLLLWMLCRVFAEECVQAEKEKRPPRLPENLGLAFREFTQLYDQGTEEQQAIQADAPVDSRKQWSKLLRHLAFALMHDKELVEFRLSMPREEAENLLTDCLQQEARANARDCAERWLNDLLTYHLIQPVIQPNFEQHIEFRHQLIQEYYAAEYLLRLLPGMSDEELKRDYLNYLKWTEPIALMLALMEGEALALQVVKLATNDVDLMLGARLAGEVKPEFQEKTVAYIIDLPVFEYFSIAFLEETQSQFAVPALLKHLEDQVFAVREKAAEALGKIGDKRAVPALLKALEDEDYHVRGKVVEALGKIGDKRATPALLEALEDQNYDVLWRTFQALGEIGDELAISPLLKILKDKDSDWKGQAIEALERIGGESVVSGLLTVLEYRDSSIYEKASAILKTIGDECVISGLTNALKHQESYVRWRVVETLEAIGDERTTVALLEALEDEDNHVRKKAAEALGKIGKEQIVPKLLEVFLQDQDPNVCRSVAEALERIGNEQVVPDLLKALKQRNTNVCRYVVEILVKIGNQCVVRQLLKILEEEKDPLICGRVATALGEIRDERAVPALLKILEIQEFLSRGIAEILGKTGGEGTLLDLLKSLQIQEFFCRSVIGALGKISGERVVSGLLKVLKSQEAYIYETLDKRGGEISSEYLVIALLLALQRDDVVRILGEIGDELVISELINAIQVQELLQRRITEASEEADYGHITTELLKILKAQGFDVRGNVAKVLGKIDGERAIIELPKFLKDQDTGVRAKAAEALGKTGSELAIPALLDALEDKNSNVRAKATEALGKTGSELAIPALLKALEDKDTGVRAKTTEALGKTGSELAIPALLKALEDKDVSVREKAVEALGKTRDERTVPALIKILEDQNSVFWSYNICWKVAELLGEIRDERAVPVLSKALEVQDSILWNKVTKALGKIGSNSSITVLLKAWNSQHSLLSASAANVIKETDREYIIPGLLKALEDQDADVCRKAVEALSEIGDKGIVPELLKVLEDRNSDIAGEAIEALGKIRDKRAVPVLLNALGDQSANVRGKAAVALGKICCEEAIPLLLNALEDQDFHVAISAEYALAQIGSPTLLSQLWQLYLRGKSYLLSTIAAIQKRCKFYNYEIAQDLIPQGETISLYFSYAPADESLQTELAKHLTLLERQGVITSWSQRQILPGDEPAQVINQQLNTADIILLLISANSMADDTCYDLEIQQAIERHQAGEARVILILLRPVNLVGLPFSHLQMTLLPRNLKAVTTWDNPDEAFQEIAEEIRKVALEVRKSKE